MSAGGRATVWVVDLDVGAERADDLIAVLDAHERERAATRRAEARRRFEVAHAALRHVLADRLSIAPREVEFGSPGEHGRPVLAADTALSFNLSHSAGLAVVALLDRADVGVDVERHAPRPIEALAARSLSADELTWWETVADPDRPREFHRAWCRKEAMLKATGRGIASLRQLTATPPPPGWSIVDVDVAVGYSAAVAARVESLDVDVWRWAPP